MMNFQVIPPGNLKTPIVSRQVPQDIFQEVLDISHLLRAGGMRQIGVLFESYVGVEPTNPLLCHFTKPEIYNKN